MSSATEGRHGTSVLEPRGEVPGRRGPGVDRHLLYLGEINDSQQVRWLRCLEAFDEGSRRQLRRALFPADRAIPAHAADIGVQVCLSAFRRERPRPWGACWVACQLWAERPLDEFWPERLPPSRAGTSWAHGLLILVAYRFLAPGSAWRRHHRHRHFSARRTPTAPRWRPSLSSTRQTGTGTPEIGGASRPVARPRGERIPLTKG